MCVARELGALRRLPSTDQQRLVKSLEQSDWVAGQLLPLVNDGVQKEPIRAMLRAARNGSAKSPSGAPV